MVEKELIKNAEEWIKSYYKDYSKDDYNIFYALNVQYKEIFHCWFLYDLLNVDGNHHQKDLFLKKFYEIVLDKRDYEGIDNIKVEREFTLSADSRVDLLLIETKGNIETKIPIEVKIYAGEGKKQLQRYVELCNNEVYFLTLNERDPVSIENTKMVKSITFETHIENWLTSCINDCTSENIKNILIQYKQVVDELTDQKGKYIYEKLKNINIQEYESIIEEYLKRENKQELDDVKTTLLSAYQLTKIEKSKPLLDFKNWLFQNIVEHIQSKSEYYEPINVDSYSSATDYHFFHPATKYGYPSVVFKFMQNQAGNQCIAFSFDIAVYACICLKFYKKVNNEWVSCDIDENKLDAELKFVKDSIERINERYTSNDYPEYFFWERVKHKDEDINFKKMKSINESMKNEILDVIKEHLDGFIKRLNYAQSLLNK